VADLVAGFLIQVIADARPVRQQLLDRHLVTDQRQVAAQHRPGGGGQVQLARFDEAHHREGGQSFAAAGDRELGIDRGGEGRPGRSGCQCTPAARSFPSPRGEAQLSKIGRTTDDAGLA
jgi:hypothetical protein